MLTKHNITKKQNKDRENWLPRPLGITDTKINIFLATHMCVIYGDCFLHYNNY